MSDISPVDQTEVNNTPKVETESILETKITRRGFLKGAAVVAGALMASRIPDISHNTLQSPKQENEARELIVGNVRVEVDSEGLPIKYILPDGKEVYFDREEVKKLREKAISSKEPEIITMIPVEGSSSNPSESQYKPSPEHPKTSELPKDVLSEEDLAKRGVKIIQADNTNLYIREGAFDKDAPLENFNKTGRKLTIVLLNGSSSTLTDEAFKAIMKGQLDPDKTIKGVRAQRAQIISYWENMLGKNRNNFKKLDKFSTWGGKGKKLETEMLSIKITLYKYQHVLTEQHIFFDYLFGVGSLGGYERGGKNPLIFLRVDEIYPVLYLYFDSKGVIKDFLSSSGHDDDLEGLRAHQTHPDPADFPLNRKASADKPYSYPYSIRKHPHYGFGLRHEFYHDTGGEGRRPEYETDIKTMEGIQKAWERWEKSGFTDNSGYYFVFSLREGGYILTENKLPSGLRHKDKL